MATTLKVAGKLAQTPTLEGCVVIATALLIGIVTDSLTGPQGPSGSSVVSVSVTVLAVISAAEGVYVASSVLRLGLNVPLPPVQLPVVALPPTVPFNWMGRFEHAIYGSPASTVATANIVIATSSETGVQAPGGSLEVSVNVTDPADISAAEGV